MINVIGDIAGNFKTLMALLKKMPEGKTVSVGDMIDRGPSSKEVIEYFMHAENVEAILGNHEHMMLDYYRHKKLGRRRYDSSIWAYNGGVATMSSFDHEAPEAVLDFIENLPQYKEFTFGNDTFLISHAFVPPEMKLEESLLTIHLPLDDSIIWNRSKPARIEKYKMQIAGHNSHMGMRTFSDEKGPFATCIDTSRDKVLTGISLPSMTVYQQEYID